MKAFYHIEIVSMTKRQNSQRTHLFVEITLYFERQYKQNVAKQSLQEIRKNAEKRRGII